MCPVLVLPPPMLRTQEPSAEYTIAGLAGTGGHLVTTTAASLLAVGSGDPGCRPRRLRSALDGHRPVERELGGGVSDPGGQVERTADVPGDSAHLDQALRGTRGTGGTRSYGNIKTAGCRGARYGRRRPVNRTSLLGSPATSCVSAARASSSPVSR